MCNQSFCKICSNEVVLFEIKVGLLQREQQPKPTSQISAKSDIGFLRYCC